MNKITQDQVTAFYDKLVFPSRTSNTRYESLVSSCLEGRLVGDFGCGQSLFINAFRKYQYRSIFLDIAWTALSEIDYGCKVQASLTEIPLPDETMDAIFCIGVVHHIPAMEKAISELIRVLKSDQGQLVLGVYAEHSSQASIRKLYDKTSSLLCKNAIYRLATWLIWLKNRKQGLTLGCIENIKRTDDLLKTPLVRYLPLEEYRKIILNHGGSISKVERISSMNILTVNKTVIHSAL